MVKRLEELLAAAKAGELELFAFRVFTSDGTQGDVAARGTEEQRAATPRRSDS